jgi:[protein-PII] uridylyltransferase
VFDKRRNTAPSAAARISSGRCAATCISFSGRAEERLSFDIQREIAQRLGYTAHPGMQDVERFMKHYFLIAKDVGDLTAILCAKLEDKQAKPRAGAEPHDGAVAAEVEAAAGADTDDFIVDNNRINLARSRRLQARPGQSDPDLPAGAETQSGVPPGRDAHRDALAEADQRQAARRPEANRLFMEILTSNDAETVLRRMNEAGVLGRFVPAFGKIVAMMQFNMYHHYTVDEHLLRCVGYVADIERGGKENSPSPAN